MSGHLSNLPERAVSPERVREKLFAEPPLRRTPAVWWFVALTPIVFWAGVATGVRFFA